MLLLLGVAAAPGCLRAWVFQRLPQPVLGPTTVPAGLDSVSQQTCAGCHVEMAAEWATTKMSKAWSDPIFQADFSRERELYACRYCHTPLPEQQPEVITGLASLKPVTGEGVPNPHYNEALRNEGVTCAACHVRDGAIVGTIPGVEAPHTVVVDPSLSAASTCASCHQADAPPFSRVERPVADTVREWERWQAATGRTESCVDCHMPAVERPLTAWTPTRQTRSHAVLGGWNDAFVASSIRVDAVERTEGGLALTVTNLAGHNVPTADPMRAVGFAVRAGEGSDALRSEVVWLERVVDTRKWVELSDNTLLPDETRKIMLPLAALPDSANLVEVEVVADRLRHAAASLRQSFPGATVVARYRFDLAAPAVPPPSEI